MSNNAGKKGKPAPWTRREQEHRRAALEAFRREHHPAYAEYCERRRIATVEFVEEAAAKFPGIGNVIASVRHSTEAMRQWDKANKTPLTWDEGQALEEAFRAQYVPVGFS